MTQTVPDISPLMPMHQDPLLVSHWLSLCPEWSLYWHLVCRANKNYTALIHNSLDYLLNSPVSQWFSPSGEQLEERILAHNIKNVCLLYSNISQKLLIYKSGGTITNLTKSLGYITDMSKYHKAGYMDYRLKYITFYVKRYIAHLVMCYNAPLVRDKPLGAPTFVKLVECCWLTLNTHFWEPIFTTKTVDFMSLQWRHNGRDGVSNHQLRGFLLNRLFRRR